MISIKSLQWEFRLAVILSITALVLSPAIGIVFGNSIDVVIIRAVIFSVIFALVGYVSVIVIKKFVPELYNAVFTISGPSGSVTSDIQNPGEFDTGVSENSMGYESGVSADLGEFAGPDNEERDDENSVETESVTKDRSVEEVFNNFSDSKMGKHILEEKGMQFEPKLMAEAIRTMMSKDE